MPLNRIKILIAFITFTFVIIIFPGLVINAQVENIPVTHPVYSFLINQESKGLLPHFSTAQIPWSKSKITDALILIAQHTDELNSWESKALKLFQTEFQITARNESVVLYSKTDSNEVLFKRLFTNDEKFIYHYQDSSDNAEVYPLGNLDFSYVKSDTASGYALMGNLGVRFSGSVGRHFGFYLQATNGTIFKGKRWVGMFDNKLRQNIKFADLNSDFDFTESHVSVEYDWFRAVMGRQTRFMGSGLYQRLYISNTSPPLDGLDLSANFSNFTYTASLLNLLGIPDSVNREVGVFTRIPFKLATMHRFSLKPSWGEVSFWEAVVYSERGYDFSYLNPFSFLKSLEHANRDRDNSLMGLDWTIRPANNFQINGAYLLDDIIFSRIGTGYWSNKMAYNLSVAYSSQLGMIGLEYARIEPYTFTHFDKQNSYTNDQLMLSSAILPNSDLLTLLYRFYFLGNRYPWLIRLSYERHGENIYDSAGMLIKNVGSDPLQSKRPQDSETVKFLGGKRKDAALVELQFGYEIVRGFNLIFQGYAKFSKEDVSLNNFRIKFSYQDF